jgi:hypothetical protein
LRQRITAPSFDPLELRDREEKLLVQQAALVKARQALEKEKERHEAAVRKARRQERQRKEELKKQQELDAANALPSHWESIDPNKTLVRLTPTQHATELDEVKAHWQSTGGEGNIVRVYRVQKEAQFRRYQDAHADLVAAGEQVHGNIVCYHGTSAIPPWHITGSDDGFDVACATSVTGSVKATADRLPPAVTLAGSSVSSVSSSCSGC